MAAVPPGLDEASASVYKRRKKVFRRALREVTAIEPVNHETDEHDNDFCGGGFD